MSRKKVRSVKDVCEDLRECYIHWKSEYFNGCNDPSWCDGINLNLVRAHIIHHKMEIETLCGSNFYIYPDEYYWPEPPVLSDDYMAKDRFLACKGVEYKATVCPYDIKW